MKANSAVVQHPKIIHSDNKSITFTIETLAPPRDLLPETSKAEVLTTFSNQIEFVSQPKQQLVKNGSHPFLYGLYQAYSEHRPFVLSPDMLWLLICQAFSRTVNYNAKEFRNYLVNFDKKKPLIVNNDAIQLGSPNSPWEKVIHIFSQQISAQVGSDFVNTLSANFSTSTAKEKIACEITIMDSVKSYFEYLVFVSICGIPTITLEGTPQDWQKLYKKTQALNRYPKTDWIEKILPLIKKIKNTSKGEIDIDFWLNIFKVHTKEEYGNPQNFDGWICHFYPFNKKGKRIDLAHISRFSIENIFKKLPSEIVCVDFILKGLNPINSKYDKEYPMRFWAGFIGLNQNANSMALRPEIDWFIGHQPAVPKLEMHRKDGISLNNIVEIPDYIYQLKSIRELHIGFLDKIMLPKELTKVKIKVLKLKGKINLWNRLKIRWQFKDTYLIINGKPQKEIPFYQRKLV